MDEWLYMDGVFDLVHSGHFNAMRQASQLSPRLCVGVNDDDDVQVCKGCRPILPNAERAYIISACKWVHRVLAHTPYTTSLRFLLDVAKCGYVAHGDDAVITTTGTDCYAEPRAAGRYKIFHRTEGISSTEITSRLTHACVDVGLIAPVASQDYGRPVTSYLSSKRLCKFIEKTSNRPSLLAPVESIQTADDLIPVCTTTGTADSPEGVTVAPSIGLANRQLPLGNAEDAVSAATKAPSPEAKEKIVAKTSFGCLGGKDCDEYRGMNVIYTRGAFDILRADHIRLLQQARSMGDYLVVGVLSDSVCASLDPQNAHAPILSATDRMLNLLALHCVDEVICNVDWELDPSMLAAHRINKVVLPKDSARILALKKEPTVYSPIQLDETACQSPLTDQSWCLSNAGGAPYIEREDSLVWIDGCYNINDLRCTLVDMANHLNHYDVHLDKRQAKEAAMQTNKSGKTACLEL